MRLGTLAFQVRGAFGYKLRTLKGTRNGFCVCNVPGCCCYSWEFSANPPVILSANKIPLLFG